jgi:hypothetical protein
MSVEAVVDILLAIAALAAIGLGVGIAISPAWAAVVVGGVVLSIIVVSRLRPGGKTE